MNRIKDSRIAWLYIPNTKPTKDLSKHDQEMIKLGWDAHSQLFLQPDYLKLSHEANMRYGIKKSEPQPLPDKALKKEINRILAITCLTGDEPDIDDQILTLLQQRVEEAREQMRAQVPNLIDEAKEQERA